MNNYIRLVLPLGRDWRYVRNIFSKHNIPHWINTKYFSIIIKEKDYLWLWKQVAEDEYTYNYFKKQYKQDYRNNKEESDVYYLNQDSWMMLSVFFIRLELNKWVR